MSGREALSSDFENNTNINLTCTSPEMALGYQGVAYNTG